MRDGETRGGKEEDGEEASDSTHQQLHSVWVCRKLESNCNHAQASELEEPESDA